MELTRRQKQEILENGFVRVPGVIPPVMVDAALRAINHSVGQGMDVADMTKFRAQSFCPELQGAPAITDLLFRTPAWALAESAIGAEKIRPCRGGQIALRFPSAQEPSGKIGCHLDGMYSPTNGVPEGTIGNFTMLLGVMLSDVVGPFAGNFTAWPGTHHLYERYFQEHGPESLLRGMPPVDLPAPEQIVGRAGDVVLCHYQVAHGVAPNASPHVRYVIFFRLHHVEHDALKWECMTDIWREWEGMGDLAGRAEGAKTGTGAGTAVTTSN